MLTGILHCQYSWLEPGSTSPAPSVNDNRIGPQLPGATHATYSGEVETERTSQQKAISRIHSEKLLTLTAWARRSDGELAQTWHQNASHQNNKASPVQSSNKHFLRTKRQEKEGKKKKNLLRLFCCLCITKMTAHIKAETPLISHRPPGRLQWGQWNSLLSALRERGSSAAALCMKRTELKRELGSMDWHRSGSKEKPQLQYLLEGDFTTQT